MRKSWRKKGEKGGREEGWKLERREDRKREEEERGVYGFLWLYFDDGRGGFRRFVVTCDFNKVYLFVCL